MSVDAVRKTNLLDLTIVLASTAVGLTLVRYYLWNPDRFVPTANNHGSLTMVPGCRAVDLWDALVHSRGGVSVGAGRIRSTVLQESAILLSLLLAAWSPALLWIRLRRPRPALAAMLRSPALTVSALATLLVVAFFAVNLFRATTQGWPTFEIPASDRAGRDLTRCIDLFPLDVFPRLRWTVGPAASIAVLMSLLLGRKHVSFDSIDRCGLVLCAIWVVIYFT